MALTLESVSYEYAAGTDLAVPALAGIDLTVEAGGLTVVLGPTGSGKTTLLRLAAGLLAPTSGTVTADGREVRSGGIAGDRFVVGIAFQRPESQLFAATVTEDVTFGPANLGLEAREAARACDLALWAVGLDPREYGGRSPFTLSGGEARRAALAGVLAMGPAYLLLDEPTAGLDAAGRESIVAAVQRSRERSGVVVVTHDPEEFLPLADRAVVLGDGRALFSGTVEGLLDDAGALYAAEAWSPPEVVRVQLDAAAHGLAMGPAVLDPEAAAASLVRAGERP